MNEKKVFPKKTYTIDSSKYRGHMTVTDDGRAIMVYASLDGHPLIKVFADESEAREWADKELAAEFREEPFYDLLNALLDLESRLREDKERE